MATRGDAAVDGIIVQVNLFGSSFLMNQSFQKNVLNILPGINYRKNIDFTFRDPVY